MEPSTGPIFVLTGPPGAGKSSVSRALLQRFPFGLHLPVDDLRDFVVSGMATPIPTWTEETTRQFRLARASAAQTAKLYANEDFAVAIDDIISVEEVDGWLEGLMAPNKVHKIFLFPSLEVARERNAKRTHKGFDTSLLDGPIGEIHRLMSAQTIGPSWLTLDSSYLTLEQTVDRILEFASQ